MPLCRGVNPRLFLGLVIFAAAGLGGSVWLLRQARTPIEVKVGPWLLRETHREQTGQQRSTRVAFADHDRKLAVLCPRYNKILLYDVTDTKALKPAAEIALEGRPVAMADINERLVVLERPAGDDKHLTPGWWEAFQFDGTRSGGRVSAGYYPDDLAVTPDEDFLLVLSSGRAEGDKSKPLPCLDVYARADIGAPSPRPLGHIDLGTRDDAARLVVSGMGWRALVTLPKAKEALAIDLSQKNAPRMAGRIPLAESGPPYVSVADDADWMVMPTLQESEAVVIDCLLRKHGWESNDPWIGCLLYTRPEESALELAQSSPRRALGRFPVKGPFNLGGACPSGLAISERRRLVAVATKSGAVHLVSIRSRLEDTKDERPDRIAETASSTEPRQITQ